jgi:putative peptidoglycan lipid II flippase
MVKKLLQFLNKEFHSINEAALLLGAFTFLSQILGLVRDRLLAHIVGAGPILDVYYAAFRVPDFLYVSLGSLASVTVLMPFIVEKMGQDSTYNDSVRKFMNNTFSAFLLVMLFCSSVIFIFMPSIAHFIAPGFTEEQIHLLINVSRMMLISPILIGISNLIGTITQLAKKFFIFSLSPVFYNFGIVLGIIILYPYFGVNGLAIGVILGAFFHMIIQIPTVKRSGVTLKYVSNIDWKEIYSIVKVSLPRTLTLSFSSIAFMALIALASTLSPGSISLFTFSFNLQSVPVGIIGISYSVAAFPMLVRSFSSKNFESFRSQIVEGARQIIFWSLPIMALFIVLRAQIVRVVLGSNAFSWGQTRLTAAGVALFVISLCSQAMVLLLVRGYYAAGNTKKPLLINLFSSVMVVIFGYIFIAIFKICPAIHPFIESILRVEGVNGTIMLALPLAYALGSLVNVILLWRIFRKDFLKGHYSGINRTILEVGGGAIILGSVAYYMLGVLDDVFSLSTFIGVFMQGFIAGVVGIIAFCVVMILLKNKEYKSLISAVRKKFWNSAVIAPEQSDL